MTDSGARYSQLLFSALVVIAWPVLVWLPTLAIRLGVDPASYTGGAMADAAYVVLLLGGLALCPFAMFVPAFALTLIWSR